MKHTQLFLLFFTLIVSIKANAVENVNTKPLSELTLNQSYKYTAQAIALNSVTLSSEVTGVIRSKQTLIGTLINKNNIVVRLDCTDKELSKEQATVALKRLQIQKELDQQQLTRAKKLVRVKSVSKQELDQKQTALDASIAQLEQQRVALKIIDHEITKCTIKAPFTGIITDNKIHPGIYVTPGSPLITLFDPNAIEIEATLPIEMIKRLQQAKTLQFYQGDKSYSISIRSVLPLVDNITKQQKIRLSVSDAVKPLANSIGTLQWKGQQAYISSQYIVQRNGQFGLFIAQNNKAIFHPLKQAIEGQISPVNLSPKTLVITNKLLILNNNDMLNQ